MWLMVGGEMFVMRVKCMCEENMLLLKLKLVYDLVFEVEVDWGDVGGAITSTGAATEEEYSDEG